MDFLPAPAHHQLFYDYIRFPWGYLHSSITNYNLAERGPEEAPNKCLLNEWTPAGLGSTALIRKRPQGPDRKSSSGPGRGRAPQPRSALLSSNNQV